MILSTANIRFFRARIQIKGEMHISERTFRIRTVHEITDDIDYFHLVFVFLQATLEASAYE